MLGEPVPPGYITAVLKKLSKNPLGKPSSGKMTKILFCKGREREGVMVQSSPVVKSPHKSRQHPKVFPGGPPTQY